MQFIKHIYLFILNNILQLKRKSFLLPLILLFPIIVVGAVIILTVLLISPDENEPIKIGIVNHDRSEETETVIQLLEDSSEFGPYIEVESMSETIAQDRIENDELSSYILFPQKFTANLYVGKSVSLHVVGNSERETESYVVKQLLDSIMRHIRTSQASILMINEHAKKIGMSDTDRQQLIFEQFTKSFLNVIGKDKVISEEALTNYVTSSPIHYFSISTIFVLSIVWLFIIYNVLYRKEAVRLLERMNLYGVTHYEQVIARKVVSLLLTFIFVTISFVVMQYFLQFNLYVEDIVRIVLIILFHSVIYLQLLAICEMIIKSDRVRLLMQLMITVILIILSGAIIPTIYLPLSVQDVISFIPSFHCLFWLQEILLNDRLYADYNLLIIYVICGFVLLGGLSIWKERVK